MEGDRVPLPKMWLSTDAREAWRLFCLSHGVTRTALMESLGEMMARIVAGELVLPPMGFAIIDRAREIDADRKRRT